MPEKVQIMRWRDIQKDPPPVNKRVILASYIHSWSYPYIYIGEYSGDSKDRYWMPIPKYPPDFTYYVNPETNEVKKVDKNDKTTWEKKADAWDYDVTSHGKIIDSIIKEANKMKKMVQIFKPTLNYIVYIIETEEKTVYVVDDEFGDKKLDVSRLSLHEIKKLVSDKRYLFYYLVDEEES